jgi:hypothetical protein
MKKINQITNGAVSANDFYSTVSSEDWEWRVTYERDFSKATDDAKKILGDMDIHPLAFSVVVEMVSQMGFDGVSQFKNFINALQVSDYQKAAQEMLDSKWGKQTPKIAELLWQIKCVLLHKKINYPFRVNPNRLCLIWVNLFYLILFSNTKVM